MLVKPYVTLLHAVVEPFWMPKRVCRLLVTMEINSQMNIVVAGKKKNEVVRVAFLILEGHDSVVINNYFSYGAHTIHLFYFRQTN